MSKQFLILAGAGVLAVAVLVAANSDGRSAAADEKIIVPKDIAEAVNKMADDASKDKGAELKKAAEAFYKKHPDDLKKTMWIFKPRCTTSGCGLDAEPWEKPPLRALRLRLF